MSKRNEIEQELLKYNGVHIQYQEAWDAHKFMIADKMFAFIGCNKIGTPILTIKLQPQECAYYRENYDMITEGYYMNKIHWISIAYEKCECSLLEDIIAKAYENFYANLPNKVKEYLEC